MQTISAILPYVQLVLAVLLIALVLLQRSSDGIEGAFGGGQSSNMSHFARRGAERILFISTIVISVLFAASAIVAIIV